MFETINSELQCDQPKVHVMQSRHQAFLKQLLIRFVKPSVMLFEAVLDVDFKSAYNLKQNSDLIIGENAKQFISKGKEVNLREERVSEFYDHVRQFFTTSCTYTKEKLPLSDELLCHAQVLDPAKQIDSQFSSLEYFLTRFPKLLPPDTTLTDIQLEFAKYQCTDIRQCIEETDRIDATWREINQLKEDGQPVFKVLLKVMVSILTIPHSSAHCERIFSIVRKNQTDF